MSKGNGSISFKELRDFKRNAGLVQLAGTEMSDRDGIILGLKETGGFFEARLHLMCSALNGGAPLTDETLRTCTDLAAKHEAGRIKATLEIHALYGKPPSDALLYAAFQLGIDGLEFYKEARAAREKPAEVVNIHS